MIQFPLFSGWIDRKAEGWAWYEEQKDEEIDDQEAALTPKAILSAAKEELEEKLATAILEPTKENIVAYIVLQKKWMNQSAKFSEEWAKVLLDFPELDNTLAHPVSYYGRIVSRKLEAEEKTKRINELSKKYALIFFYEGSNKISQALSKILQEFSKKYDWKVFGVSHDGVILESFAKTKIDAGLSEKFRVQKFPAVFVVSPSTEEAIPIAYGLTSIDTIEENIVLRFPKNEGITHD